MAYAPHSRRAGIPRVLAHETPFGMTQELRHKRSTELNHFIMPNLCYLQFDYLKNAMLSTLFAYVPIDDTHHYHYFSMTIRTRLAVKTTSIRLRTPRMTSF